MVVDGVFQATATQPFSLDHFWQAHGEWVEAPNQRRGGESGVKRVQAIDGETLYVKRQVGHVYRSWLHPLGRPTVLRERAALTALRDLGVKVPAIVFCNVQRDPDNQWRGVLVTRALDGFQDLAAWSATADWQHAEPALQEALLQALALTLARMHRARWQHGCLYEKHVFVRVVGQAHKSQVQIALLDLEKSRRRISASHAAQHDLKQLRRHSSFSEAQWSRLLYFYFDAFGSAIKGLES